MAQTVCVCSSPSDPCGTLLLCRSTPARHGCSNMCAAPAAAGHKRAITADNTNSSNGDTRKMAAAQQTCGRRCCWVLLCKEGGQRRELLLAARVLMVRQVERQPGRSRRLSADVLVRGVPVRQNTCGNCGMPCCAVGGGGACWYSFGTDPCLDVMWNKLFALFLQFGACLVVLRLFGREVRRHRSSGSGAGPILA